MTNNTILDSKVKDTIIYLTSACNLSCQHCYINQKGETKELTTDDLDWIKNTFKIRNTMLIGGEPTLYPQLEYAINLFDKVTLSTNGVLLANNGSKSKELIDIFKSKEENISIQLSIDGGEKETDSIRGEGVWKKVITAAHLLKANNIPCYFRCGYGNSNLNSLAWIIDNVSHLLNMPLVLFPWVGTSPLTTEQQIWLFNMILEKNQKYNSHNLIAQPHFMQWLGEKGRCEAASERLCITYDKEITPCHFDFDYILGSIGMNLATLNKNREMFLKTGKRIQPSCDFCDNVEICRSSCYMTESHAGCPLKGRYTLEAYAYTHNIDAGILSTQISDMKGLLKESLIC